MAHDPKPHGRARGPTIPRSIQIMPVVPHPRLVAAACMDPTLAYMIENGVVQWDKPLKGATMTGNGPYAEGR